MSDLSVVYYTSNREEEAFEHKILENLLRNIGQLPLVTVSFKPMRFGKNICVGEQEPSYLQIVDQIRRGIMATETEYIATAEADCLYPPEYFLFRPVPRKRVTFYYPRQAYLTWHGRYTFWPKAFRDLMCITARRHLLYVLDWLDMNHRKYGSREIARIVHRRMFDLEIPVVSLKTRRALHGRSPHGKKALLELPYWGTAAQVWKRLE